jgi:two-component system nitrogen regulation sensor histidine kinase NtrY
MMARVLERHLALLIFVVMIGSAVLAEILVRLDVSPVIAVAIFAIAGLPAAWLIARLFARPLRHVLASLRRIVSSYHEGDFSASLVVERNDEVGELFVLHNELGRAIREERSQLAERELLLETAVQNSPVALLLVDSSDRVVFANLAGRQLFNQGRVLVGEDFAQLLSRGPAALRAAVAEEDTLFTVTLEDVDETFHCSRRAFQIRGHLHRLYLLKRLTRELSRQEVATWKKLVRVLSHELNNSLAPITSLAQTGAQLTRRGRFEELERVFGRIEGRSEHLYRFIAGYAAFAKLPAPRPQRVNWREFVTALAAQHDCRIAGTVPQEPGWFDPAQLEQALINVLKNAREAGGPPTAIEVAVTQHSGQQRIDVRDGGPGMSDAVLAQALLPFYSTKRNGTGLGLALVREIVEAHGGHVRLSRLADARFCVTLVLPLPSEGVAGSRQGRL